MKTRRILSFCLTLLLCLSLVPAVSLSSSAATVLPDTAGEMPTTLPDGSAVDSTKLWVDWSSVGVGSLTANAYSQSYTPSTSTYAEISDDGFYQQKSKNVLAWTGKWTATRSWRGASGIMFYVDASEASGVDFIVQFLMNDSRQSSASGNALVQFQTSPAIYVNGAVGVSGTTSTAYAFSDGAWKSFSVSYPKYYLTSSAGSGWYYIPLTSFWYHGGGANGYAYNNNDPGVGMNFVEFASRFQNQWIRKIGLKSDYPGLKFGDVYFVYSNPDAEQSGATAPLFGTMAQNGAAEGSAAGSIANNALTVTAMPNSATSSASRIWLKGMSTADKTAASGIRFHVDTTALGEAAQLRLRLRLMYAQAASTIGAKQDKETGIFAAGTTLGYLTPSGGYCQYVCRSDNSVAYYFDENGTPVALHVASDVSSAAESDLFDALPAGYVGDIYVPLDSFWLSVGSYNSNGTMKLFLPYSEAKALYPFTLLGVCHAVDGTATDNTVVYSNFELVYPETRISGASVTLKNSLDVNFFVTPDGATDAKMTFAVGTKAETVEGTVQEDGRIKFVCSGILPQKLGDTITATLTAKVNGTAVSETVQYSVRDYCENMLAKDSTDATVKKLLVDLLYYAEAAQTYASYKTEDLVTGKLTEAQKALHSADTTGGITATASKSGTADENYKWHAASLRLESTVAIRLKLKAPSKEGLTVKVTLNGRTVTYTGEDMTDEGNGIYSVIFNNIGASEYGDTVTATMEKDGAQIGETLSYSVAAYIASAVKRPTTDENALALIRALWSYGESAKAVSAS